MSFTHFIELIRFKHEKYQSYLRAKLYSARGSKIAPQVSIEKGCVIDRPWGVQLGTRVVLDRNVRLKLVADDARVSIGEYTFLGTGVQIDVMKGVLIGNHTLIAPNCFITDHNHGIARHQRIDQQDCLSQPVVIGDDVWLGTGVIVLPGVRIEDGAVVGAGAVVTHDIPAYAISVGVPAQQIGKRN